MKHNNIPLYVNTRSNHPKIFLDNIPLALNERLNRISSNKSVFDAASTPYQEALEKSGYSHRLQFTPPPGPPSAENKETPQPQGYLVKPTMELCSQNKRGEAIFATNGQALSPWQPPEQNF